MGAIYEWSQSRGCLMPFEFRKFEISGPQLVCPRIFDDERGYFFELYKHTDFTSGEIEEHFVQDNFSRSAKGVLRGLHYQKDPAAQGKLVMCMKGVIYDVAVDIRKGSPTFGKWVGAELTDSNRFMLYVPPGFAHGFQVISDGAEVLYKCTAEYSPQNDRGIIWNDRDINISWPLAEPVFSSKDKLHPALRDADNNYTYYSKL
jgi:dTDP-4-dehydrorhamnose 3,5-epimerase